MAHRTNTESIRELEISVAMLSERVDIARIEIASGSADSKQVAEAIPEIRTRLAGIEQRFDDLKQTVEGREQRRWGVVLIVMSALAGGIASVLLLEFCKIGFQGLTIGVSPYFSSRKILYKIL